MKQQVVHRKAVEVVHRKEVSSWVLAVAGGVGNDTGKYVEGTYFSFRGQQQLSGSSPGVLVRVLH